MLPSTAPPAAPVSGLLVVSALLIATCGLIYELVAGALASYLLGDSITQFSLIIGAYLSAMGLGSYLSKFIDRGLVSRFVEIEIAVALIGGFEAPMLFAAFTYTPGFAPVLYGLVLTIGALVGLELPLLIRILERQSSLKELVARVMFLDYIGALFASLLFPLLLVPRLGLLRTSLVFGILNAAVALWTTFLFEAPPAVKLRLRLMAVAALAVLGLGFGFAGHAERAMDAQLFADPVVLREVSPYQRVTVTHRAGDTRLFLDGALQFSSVDEHRYHESLVHPALRAVQTPTRVLILGGGDGLAAREVLKHEGVEEIVLVDLDPIVTRLFTEREELRLLNDGALTDPRVKVVNDDAFRWLQGEGLGRFDAVIIDFPDPNDYALGKLYTNHFYRMLTRVMAPHAVGSIQATSPLFSPDAYWCIMATLGAELAYVRPYHAYIPAFGEWGFALFSKAEPEVRRPLPLGLRFLDDATIDTLFQFPVDLRRGPQPVNRLDDQVLVRLYDEDWQKLGGH